MTTSPVMGITEELVAELEAVAHTGKGAFMIECAEVHALLTERAELMRDAERYRWLREPCSGAERVVTYGRGDYGRGLMSYTMLDAAIDAAMQSEAKP